MSYFTLKTSRSFRRRRGFTLIEMLMVIAIIAILAGLLIPVIGAVRRRGQVAATVLEIQNLKVALESYKQKFGDYPPDGSNSVVFQRHIRIAFPRIAPQEINNLNSLIIEPHEPAITKLDPAETLVFFLGGFSDDPRYPFTGKGGPLTGNRNPGIFDFDPQRLSVSDAPPVNIGTKDIPIMVPLSNDEAMLHNSINDIDIFPVYYPKGSDVPFVYFDSRTYMFRAIYAYNNNAVLPARYPSWHQEKPSNIKSIARPYRSDQPRQATTDDPNLFKWVNPDTFQLIAAGTSDNYGTDPNPLDYKYYPAGANYSEGDNSNITSFSRGTLEDDIP